MSKVVDLPKLLEQRRTFQLFDDFLWYLSPHLWTSLAADSLSTVAIDADGVGGVTVITASANTDNNETALVTTNELFLWATGKPLIGEARIKFTDPNTDDGNVLFGFMDDIAANAMLDNGGGPKADFDGAVIYKLDGGTVWRCRTSNGTSNTDSVSTKTAGGSAYQTLRIEMLQVGSNFEVTFFVDGEQLVDSNNTPIKHVVALASSTEMDFGVYGKVGSTSADLVINVDYLCAAQLR